MLYRSKWHKLHRAMRVARHRALTARHDSGSGVNESAYRRFVWLVDNGQRFARSPTVPPLAVQCVRVRAFLAMKKMGWRDILPASG